MKAMLCHHSRLPYECEDCAAEPLIRRDAEINALKAALAAERAKSERLRSTLQHIANHGDEACMDPLRCMRFMRMDAQRALDDEDARAALASEPTQEDRER